MGTEHSIGGVVIKDSGERRVFPSGANRDRSVGKGDFTQLPFQACLEIAQIFEIGATKYTKSNWKLGMPLSEYLNSAIRHALKAAQGWDDESNHAAMAAWNMMCFIETRRVGKIEEKNSKEEMTDSNNIIPAEPTPPAKITDKQADRMLWVFGRIAEGHHSPGPPGSAWGGREEVITSAMGVLEIDRPEAERVVDDSVAALWAGSVEDNKHVLRATMVLRLIKISELLTSMINGSRTEVTYGFNEVEGKPGHSQRYKMKEKVVPNDNNAIAGRLLEVNRDLAVLQGIDGGQSGTAVSVSEIMQQLTRVAEKTGKNSHLSMKIKAGGAGAKLIMDAAGQFNPSKRVKSSDVSDDKKKE